MRQRVIAFILLIIFAAGGVFYFFKKDPTPPVDINTNTMASPVTLPVTFINSYIHDTASFTQGFQIVDGYLYESTGNLGTSYIRKLELTTGKVLQQKDLDKKYFGEGITVLNGKIYQLTWQDKIGFIYNMAGLKQEKSFDVPHEGWGITNDGKQLIISDGTNIIRFYDPGTLKETSRISVQDNNGMLSNINELEWIDGYIYANVWQTNYILKIDPSNGNVVAKADLTQQIETALPGFDWENNVLNGIAYDPATKKIYVTGKNWPKLFEVKFN